MNVIDEPGIPEFFGAGDPEAAGMDRGWESTPDSRNLGAPIELGPAADRILIQSWRILKSRNGRGD